MQLTTRQVGLTQISTETTAAKTSTTGFEAMLVTVADGFTYAYQVEIYDELQDAWCVVAALDQAQTTFVHPLYGANNVRINVTSVVDVTSIDSTLIERRFVS